MFVLTALVYPVVLALLCGGAGLLVDRASGGVAPAMLLLTVGAAALIVVSQLTTWVSPIAPATPYVLVAVAAAGLVLGWGRTRELARGWGGSLWQLALVPLAYLLALAPALLAGRPTFSSYMALADSAVHMLGADFLLRHGQDYSHLDLRNSYGLFMRDYYGSGYPSGADTLFGGSAFLLRLPLIWTFQPFVAFMLAMATGPAWALARGVGLDRAWAAAASLTATLAALVYAYELIGSIKEIVALALILSLGALVVEHRRWLWGSARGAIPFALVVAAGVAALGVAFGAWALAATLVLAGAAIVEAIHGERGTGGSVRVGSAAAERAPATGGKASMERAAIVPTLAAAVPTAPARSSARAPAGAIGLGGLAVVGLLVLLVGAWPTWTKLAGSLRVAQTIASTSNPGNLHSSLRPAQLLGVWLGGSYKLLPAGGALTLTYVLAALVLLLAVVGMGNAVRSGRYAFACWFASTIVLLLLLSAYTTTWADAKTLMLTSPAVVLMAWAGVAALRASSARTLVPLLAFVLLGGVFVSDALQYHESNLAPTARYEELASIDTRFAGRGPTLLTDFDEYALYELRDMDVGGPDFVYPPPALATAAGGYGEPVDLDRIAPAALLAYPLILTRRDPSAVRPPAAYRLEWQGVYYQVWARRPHAPAALAHVGLSGSLRTQCARIALTAAARSGSAPRVRARVGEGSRDGTGSFAAGVGAGSRGGAGSITAGVSGESGDRVRGARGVTRDGAGSPGGRTEASLVAALAPELVTVPLAGAHRPPGWSRGHVGIVMGRAGVLRATFTLPHGGAWELWLKGDIMPTVSVAIDGRPLGSIGAQLDGNSLVLNPLTPLRATLSAGPHTLTIARPATSLAPGGGGAARLAAIFLVPAGARGEPRLRSTPVARWRALCGAALQWVELVPAGGVSTRL
jgi:hypothetical protein